MTEIVSTDPMDRPITYPLPNGDEMKLTMNMVREYCVSGNKEMVSNQELNYFMQTCKAMRLNPFLKECWLIKYSGTEPAQIIASIHKLRAIAMGHPLCQGWTKGLILWNHKTNEEHRTPGFVPPGWAVVGAYFKATPKGWSMPYDLEINLKGYIKKTKEGNVTKFWQEENWPTMIMKVVESQGLRAVFSDATKGLYVAEEFNQGMPIDITPETPQIPQETDDKPVDYAAVAKDAPTDEKTTLPTHPDLEVKPDGSLGDKESEIDSKGDLESSETKDQGPEEDAEPTTSQDAGSGDTGGSEEPESTLVMCDDKTWEKLKEILKEADAELAKALQEHYPSQKPTKEELTLAQANALIAKAEIFIANREKAIAEKKAADAGSGGEEPAGVVMCDRKTWERLGAICDDYGKTRKEILLKIYPDRKPYQKELPQVDALAAIERVAKAIAQKKEEEAEAEKEKQGKALGEWQIPGWVQEEARTPANDQYAPTPGVMYDFFVNFEKENEGIKLTQEIVDKFCKDHGSVKALHNLMVNPSIAKQGLTQLVMAFAGIQPETKEVEKSEEKTGDDDYLI